jgi:hypothetical protein
MLLALELQLSVFVVAAIAEPQGQGKDTCCGGDIVPLISQYGGGSPAATAAGDVTVTFGQCLRGKNARSTKLVSYKRHRLLPWTITHISIGGRKR